MTQMGEWTHYCIIYAAVSRRACRADQPLLALRAGCAAAQIANPVAIRRPLGRPTHFRHGPADSAAAEPFLKFLCCGCGAVVTRVGHRVCRSRTQTESSNADAK